MDRPLRMLTAIELLADLSGIGYGFLSSISNDDRNGCVSISIDYVGNHSQVIRIPKNSVSIDEDYIAEKIREAVTRIIGIRRDVSGDCEAMHLAELTLKRWIPKAKGR